MEDILIEQLWWYFNGGKNWILSSVKNLFLKEKTIYEIKGELKKVYEDSAPSLLAVKYCTDEFKHGHSSIFF